MFCQVCCHNREPWQQYLYSNKRIVLLATIANLATNQGLTVCLLDMPSAYALCMSIPGRQFSISFFAVNGNKYSPANFVHSIYWVSTLRIVSGKSPQLWLNIAPTFLTGSTAASHQPLEPIVVGSSRPRAADESFQASVLADLAGRLQWHLLPTARAAFARWVPCCMPPVQLECGKCHGMGWRRFNIRVFGKCSTWFRGGSNSNLEVYWLSTLQEIGEATLFFWNHSLRQFFMGGTVICQKFKSLKIELV